MRFILLTIFLCITCNTYAAIDTNAYIYVDDSNEKIKLKTSLDAAKDSYAKTFLKTSRINKNMLDGYDRDEEVVYKVGDTSKKDVGAKIGMSKEQILNKTYWGKPNRINTDTNNYDKIELWTYKTYGSSSLLEIDALLFFKNDKLTYILN